METLVRNYIELAREDPIDLADFRAFKEQIPTEPAADRSVAAEWDMIRHLLDAPIQEIKSVHWAMEDVRAAAVRIELCLDKELSRAYISALVQRRTDASTPQPDHYGVLVAGNGFHHIKPSFIGA